MANRKLKVAVTGGIGSGKSAFCNFLKEKNFPVINADEIAKQLLSDDEEIKARIKKLFGESAYKNGKPDHKFLANKVFSDINNTTKINSILHPAVIIKTEELTGELFKKNNIVFTEAALIFEAGIENSFDYIVLISADKNLRLQRTVKQRRLTAGDFERRDRLQMGDNEKRKRADFVFENNGTLNELKEKAGLLLNILKGIIKQN